MMAIAPSASPRRSSGQRARRAARICGWCTLRAPSIRVRAQAATRSRPALPSSATSSKGLRATPWATSSAYQATRRASSSLSATGSRRHPAQARAAAISTARRAADMAAGYAAPEGSPPPAALPGRGGGE